MSIAEVAARCAAAALVVVAFAACTSPAGDARAAPPRRRRAATLPEPPATEFDPGYIVSDDAFYDSSAMTEDEIQAFLESVPCRPDEGVRCLADYPQTTTTQPAVGGAHCAGVPRRHP